MQIQKLNPNCNSYRKPKQAYKNTVDICLTTETLQRSFVSVHYIEYFTNCQCVYSPNHNTPNVLLESHLESHWNSSQLQIGSQLSIEVN